MNIILCGLPKCGKSTVGQILADQLALPFLDTDQAVITYYHKQTGTLLNCREIALKKGLAAFRQLESSAIQEIKAHKSVIALGGGALELEANQLHVQKLGFIIYLQGDPEQIFKRLSVEVCPPYLDPNNPYFSFCKLAEKRIAIFKKVCNLQVNLSRITPRQAALEIMHHIQNKGWYG